MALLEGTWTSAQEISSKWAVQSASKEANLKQGATESSSVYRLIKQINNLPTWAAKIEQENKTTVNKKAHLKGCAPKLKMQCWNDIKLAPAKNPALGRKKTANRK